MTQGQVFACLKKAVDNFHHYNVDMACILLETCGRFLFNQPESRKRMEILINIVKRKKVSSNLEQERIIAIENALYLTLPIKLSKFKKVKPVKSSVQLYAEKLLRSELHDKNAKQIFNLLRTLPWNNQEIQNMLMKIFVKIWKLKESNISIAASIIAGIKKIHPEFVITLVEELIENFYIDLHQNSPESANRRVMSIRFLADLFNFQIIEAEAVFEILWTLISYGHPAGIPTSINHSEIDRSDDHFRICLICILMKQCGIYFVKGKDKSKLEKYILFFQYYISTKSTLNFEMKSLLEETFLVQTVYLYFLLNF
jgi:regulator of nonsense transcripts 2